jgi:hypothetical protein
MRVYVINNYQGSGNVRVHREGCRDIAKEIPRSDNHWKLDVPAGESVADAVADDLCESFGWSPDSEEPKPWNASDITVLPCCERRSTPLPETV